MESIFGGLVCIGVLVAPVVILVALLISAKNAGKQHAARQQALAATYVNQAKFQAVTTGMKFSDVLQILGPPEAEVSSVKVAETVVQTYRWKAGALAHALLTFENGSLASKAAVGF